MQTVEQSGVHAHAKPGIGKILEFDALLAPDCFDCPDGRPPRVGFALLELVDCALRQAGVNAELALAPPEHCPRHAELSGKGLPFEPDKREEITRARRYMQ